MLGAEAGEPLEAAPKGERLAEEIVRGDEKPPRRIVLVQPGFVGDVVFTSPLVHALKEAYPQAEVTLMVRPERAEVAGCIPGVEGILVFDKRGVESGPSGLLKASRKLRRGRFDVLIAPHRSSRTALLAALSGVPRRVGYRCGLGRMCYHQAVPVKENEPCRLFQDFHLIEALGVKPTDSRVRLKVPSKQSSYLDSFHRANGLKPEARLVALCIGSVWPTKRWPAIYFASLAGALRERAYNPVLFGGQDDLPIAVEIEKAVAGRKRDSTPGVVPGDLRVELVSCVGNSLAEAAALLDRCEMAVGGDTGLTHMARALGVPTAIIYGPTDHHVHAFGERTKVLFAKIKCRPCHRHGQNRCPELHHDCMRLVSPEQVLDAFREIAGLQTPVPPMKDEGRRMKDEEDEG